MKRIFILLALATAATFGADAQMFPLMEVRKSLQDTKGFIVTGQVTQKEVDMNDSTCRLEIISFDLPAKRAKIFDKVVEEYNRESELSDGSHSFVADLGMPAAERDAIPGIKAVKLYYSQGRPYIRTGNGHNFVSVRRNLDNPLYRTTTCIEWWPEDTLGTDGGRLLYGKVAGRIITVKGPVGDKAYMQKPEPVKQGKDGECFVALQEVLELVRMYSLRESALQKDAVILSINKRIETIVSSIGHKDHVEHIKTLLSALSDLPSYRCDVVFPEGSGIPDLLNVPVSDVRLHDVAGISFFPRESPEASKYGEQSADGLFVIKARTIQYDKSAPPLKIPYLSKPSKNYDPYNGRTFPVYTGFSTIPYPPEDEEDDGFGKYALWCTADSTYLISYSRVRSNAHYWHRPHEGITLRDRLTGKEYPLRSTWGVPVDTTYFISGHVNDIVCFVSVYDALPPTATTIDILYKHVDIPTPQRGTGWADGKSYYNISVADLQKNQQKIIGKPWIINRPDKVRRYIVDGRVATMDDADKVSDIETIKLCSDGQLFLFSKVPEDVKTVPYYFISYDSAHLLTILVKLLPEGTVADASYSLEEISKMLNVGIYTNVNIEVLESDCKTSVVDSVRSYLDSNKNRILLFEQFKTQQEDQHPFGKGYNTLCPGHKVVTHTVHLDAENHFILDGEDIVPRTLYGRVLRIVEREGESSLCVFKISCEPESSFNYYCQVVKNMQRAQIEIRSRLNEVLTPELAGNRSQSSLIYTIFSDMAPIRICEEPSYEEDPKDNNPYLQFRKQLLMDLSVTIDGVKHPELRDFGAILDYTNKEGRLIDSIRYYSNGKELDLTGGRLSLSGEDEKYEVVMTTVQKSFSSTN